MLNYDSSISNSIHYVIEQNKVAKVIRYIDNVDRS
jgi:hypothetical protein